MIGFNLGRPCLVKSLREQQAVNQCNVFKNYFGYIQRHIFSDHEISILLIDQPMVMLYHGHVKQYTLHIDATGLLIRKLRHLKKFCIILLLNISQPTKTKILIKGSWLH